ncbi:MAG: hypothetical protein OXG78_02665 [Chloroflexi bacterium]|nr:hypothetical protein [Chloroflexota bacterium]
MTSRRTDALSQALFDFDGRSTGPLERFAAAHSADASLVAELCDFAGGDDHNLQTAATWLLKRFGVTGAQLSPSQSEMLLRLLIQETGWLPRIHVLQMMDTLVVPSSRAAPLMDALAAQARGANIFIRAWSVHGAAVLADQHPAYRDSVLDLLAAAEQDDAASVRARIRRTRRAFDWC